MTPLPGSIPPLGPAPVVPPPGTGAPAGIGVAPGAGSALGGIQFPSGPRVQPGGGLPPLIIDYASNLLLRLVEIAFIVRGDPIVDPHRLHLL